MEFDALISLQKTSKRPKNGDIFVLCPKKDLYCFGKVIDTNIKSSNVFLNGMNLIYVYDYFVSEAETEKIEHKDILFAEIVNNQLWYKGYAQTLYNSPVTLTEKNVDIGFLDTVHIKENYVDINGNLIGYIPKIKGVYGLGSYRSVGKEIQKILSERKML